MKSFYKIFTVSCLMLFTVQCEVIDADLLNSPNAVSPENVDPNFLLNNIQMNAQDIYSDAAEFGAEMTRMRYMFGDTYGNAYNSQNFNSLYQNAYADLFIDVENLLPIAEERNLYFHAGIAKTLKAYTMLTMVDMFGDVPYSQALDPSNFNPGTDAGADIYAEALTLLDQAIANFQNEDRRALPTNDLYYSSKSGEDKVNAWIKAANTIKLKAYLNTGNASAVNALIDDGNLILNAEDNFTYEFSTNRTNPDARHPLFASNYVDGANDYMTVNYLNMILNDKADEDPRLRYYFYRQTTSDPTDVNLNTCINAFPPSHFQANDPFCLLGDGWWGRDHLIDDGIPPDRGLRTTVGVYPAGGRFDASQSETVSEDMGEQGAGFEPILMSSYTWFMRAEAQLMLNSDPGAARAALNEALIQSFEAVRSFGSAQAEGTGFEITDASRDNYIATVLDRWDNDTDMPASDTPDEYKLRIIAKEYYLALWPNGLEAYNSMRRTGYPDRADNLQPARAPSPGDWYRTLSYPANMIERNSNVSAKSSNLVRTFWDTRGQDDEFNF